jgi:hypothetical protein
VGQVHELRRVRRLQRETFEDEPAISHQPSAIS